MKKIYLIYTFLISLMAVHLIEGEVYAAGEDDNLGYTVNLVQPKTQIDPEKSYFYIQTKPGEAQTLEVRVKSTKKEPVDLNIYGMNAITGDGGTIEYSEDKTLYDKTLKDPIISMIKVETPTITVGNFEEKTVKIQVTPPKESYAGVKMGALVFALDQGKNEKNGVSTEFSYRVGLMTAESGDEFNNGKTLNLTEAKASIKRGKKMVLATLQNPEPKVLENMTIVATMTTKGTGKVVKRKGVENYKMAPNSQFDFEMDWGVDSLPSGEYMLKLEVKNDYDEWELSKEFTITNQQAKKMNEESAFKIVTPSWIKVMTVLLYIMIILIGIVIYRRRKKWEIQWKKVRLSKRKKKNKNKKLQSKPTKGRNEGD